MFTKIYGTLVPGLWFMFEIVIDGNSTVISRNILHDFVL